MGIAKLVPGMRKELEHQRAENVGLRQARLDKPSPIPFRVDLLKVADSRCPNVLVTAAPYLISRSFFERGLWRMTQKKPKLH